MNMEIDIQNLKVKSVEIDSNTSNMFPLDSDTFSNIKCEIKSETALIVKKEIPGRSDFSSESGCLKRVQNIEFEEKKDQKTDVEKQPLSQHSESGKHIKRLYDCKICGKGTLRHFMIKQNVVIVKLVEKHFLTNIT